MVVSIERADFLLQESEGQLANAIRELRPLRPNVMYLLQMRLRVEKIFTQAREMDREITLLLERDRWIERGPRDSD